MCYGCLEEYLKLPDSTKCPICREPIDPSAPPPPPHPSSNNRPYYTGRDNRGTGDDSDPTSCGSTNNYSGSYSRRYREYDATPEIIYRVSRMRLLYPQVMTPQLQSSLQNAAQTGTYNEFIEHVRVRQDEVRKTLLDMENRKKAAASGRSGASRGFGGGSSSGGRGGRW